MMKDIEQPAFRLAASQEFRRDCVSQELLTVVLKTLREKLGNLNCRERPTSLLACLAGYMRLHGVPVQVDDFLDYAPLPPSVPPERLVRFIARRLGIAVSVVAPEDFKAALDRNALLVQTTVGYSYLLFGCQMDQYIAGFPGLQDWQMLLKPEQVHPDNIAAVYAISRAGRWPPPRRGRRLGRLWSIAVEPSYLAHYDQMQTARHGREFAAAQLATGQRELRALPLQELTEEAIQASHASILPGLPQYFGRYRWFNLRRSTGFVDHSSIPHAMAALLRSVRLCRPVSVTVAVRSAAEFFSDFLVIHPFANGNQRIGMLFVDRFLAQFKLRIRWENFNSTHYYYWMRCAAKGHLAPLERAFGGALAETAM